RKAADVTSGRKDEAAVRRDVRARLEDELVAGPQPDRPRVPPHAQAVPKQGDVAVEAQQLPPSERHAPDREEIAELRRPVESDDAGGRRRPRVRAAAGAAHADTRGNDDREAVREQLDVHAPHRRSGNGARRVHRRTRLIPRPHSDRRRHYRHLLEAIALVGLLAGCGGGGSTAPTIAGGAAHTYAPAGFTPARPVKAGTATRVSFTIVQPDGEPLTQYKHGAGPHDDVHLV